MQGIEGVRLWVIHLPLYENTYYVPGEVILFPWGMQCLTGQSFSFSERPGQRQKTAIDTSNFNIQMEILCERTGYK